MAVQVRELLHEAEYSKNEAILQCTTTGRILNIILNADSAEDFLEWLPMDARRYTSTELRTLYYEYLDEREQGK